MLRKLLAAIEGRYIAIATVLGGCALIGYGAATIYTPAGLIIGGVLAIVVGLHAPLGDRR